MPNVKTNLNQMYGTLCTDNTYKPTTIFDHATLEQALETIEDALCYGFELIVENGHVLWRDTLPDTDYSNSVQ